MYINNVWKKARRCTEELEDSASDSFVDLDPSHSEDSFVPVASSMESIRLQAASST